MPSQNKSLWIVIVLVAAGAIIFYFSVNQNNSSNDRKIVMQDVLSQKPSLVSAVSVDADRDPVPSPAIVTSPEHGKEAGFAVQVYSFRDQKRATAAVTNLKKSGFKAYEEISDLGSKGTWYRVRVGGLANETEAKAMLENVRKNFKSGIIIKPQA